MTVTSPAAISARPNCATAACPPGAQGAGERPDQGGTVENDEDQLGAEHGDDEHDPGGDDQPGRALQLLHPGILGLAGDQAAERGPDAPEQVGHPDQVREDKVPVEAQRRHELLNDLRVGQHDRAGQHREASRPVCRRQCEHEDRVEVDAPQVGADPAGASQPVGVGDVGEERRPHHVEAHADDTGTHPAVTAGGGVAALVEQRGEQGQAEQHQHRHRVRHHVFGGRGDLAAAEQPRIRRDQAGQHHDHDERAEKRPEQAREELHARLGDQGAAQLQREQP